MFYRIVLSVCCLFILVLCSIATGQTVSDAPATTATTTSTTEKSTTTTTTTETTTTVPNTTIVPPTPTVPTYFVFNKSDICLMVQMNLQFKIHYFDKKGIESKRFFYLNSTTTDIPVMHGGDCKNDTQNLNITWVPEPKSSWNMYMLFVRKSTGQFTLKLVSFNYTLSDKLFNGTNDTSTHHVQQNYTGIACRVGTYYQCMAMQTTELLKSPFVSPSVIQPRAYVVISDMRAEAFRLSSNPIFVGSKCECSADYVPNKVIPIVVGVALATMIIIALVTFIIGSRRRQAGYQEI